MKAKKFLAFLLAVVLVLSLGVTAFAVNSDGESYTKGSITIKNPQKGETYKAYKIFDVTYDLGEDGAADDKYAYTTNSTWQAAAIAYTETTADANGVYTGNGLTLTPVKDTAGTVKFYNVTFDKDTFSAPDFGEKMAAAASSKTADKTFAEDDNGKMMAKDLDLGYYMIQPNSQNALVSLTTTDKDVQVSDKNEKPVVDKKLVGEDPIKVLTCTSTEDGHTHSDDCYIEQEKDYTTKSVGDTVDFELDTKVPDMTGYTKYFFVMNDTLTAGLTFNNDVAITLGGEPLTVDNDYTVKVTNNDDGTTNIRIVFKDMTKWWNNDEDEDHEGEPIVIKYSATVDEDAIMGTEGNTNTAKIEYSNNPNIVPNYDDPDTEGDDPDPDPENPDPDFDPDDPQDPKYKHNQTTETTTDDPTGESASDKVTVYTAELDLTKVDAKDGTTLTGAKFKIEGDSLNVSIVSKTIFKESTDGTWYRLKDGTYTEESPDKNGENKTTYAEMGEAFEPVGYTELFGNQAVANVGLYFSKDNGTTKTLITDVNQNDVPADAKIYQPTYNTVGLFVKQGEGENENYVKIIETNAAQYTNGPFYKATVWKQSDLYEDTTKKYVKVEVIDKTSASENYTAEGFVGADGKITFGGLAEGTYQITELIAPDGYNLLKEPIEVVVKLVQDSTDTTGKTYKFQVTVDGAETPVAENGGVLSFDVRNNKGTELPETGGMGTTLIYVIGSLLVLGAGVLLIVKKRMSVED